MTLEELRDEIDTLDANILQLLNQRAQCVISVGKIKKQRREEIFVASREKAIMERLTQLNTGPLSYEILQQIFQTIIETMKTLQQ